MEFRRRFGLDHLFRRRVGAGAEIPDPRHRPLCRPQRARVAVGHVRGKFALPSAARRQARLFGAHPAHPRLLRALDAVHRLEQVGRPVAASLQRPAILPGRRRAVVAHRAGQGAAPLRPRRRMAARDGLRHGHRRGRPRRLRLSGILPHLDGRRQAAEAGSRRRARRNANLSRHRRRSRRDRSYSLYRRRQTALDGLALGIRRLQQ